MAAVLPNRHAYCIEKNITIYEYIVVLQQYWINLGMPGTFPFPGSRKGDGHTVRLNFRIDTASFSIIVHGVRRYRAASATVQR